MLCCFESDWSKLYKRIRSLVVISPQFTIRLVQWLGWVFKPKKKRKKEDLTYVFFIHAPCFLMCILFYVSFIWIHVYAFALHFMVYCGSAFEPGSSGLSYYCTSICVHSWCNWRASCVDSKPKKNMSTGCKPWIIKYVGSDCHGVRWLVPLSLVCTSRFLASARVLPLPGGLLPSQHKDLGFYCLLLLETVD